MHSLAPQSLLALSRALDRAEVSARELTERALATIADPDGDGRTTFLSVFAESARAEADFSDAAQKAGRAVGPLAGLPISVKDLFDIGGLATTAGSVVLADAPRALTDAPAVSRLRAAGAVVLGRTNMTEFAYSGLGLNPHHGTPRSIWRRGAAHAPGGSSSGAAVSVAAGMAVAGIGTDTGGSVRIPAAWNGLVGFKPSAGRVPTLGVFPLSTSLDTIGPIARTVADCRLLDAVMSGARIAPGRPRGPEGLRLGVVATQVRDLCDGEVDRRFETALSRLGKRGAHLVDLPLAAVERAREMAALGTIAAAEAFHLHRPALDRGDGARYDPRVAVRIERGRAIGAADYLEMLAIRRTMRAEADRATRGFDAILAPTVAILPPRIADLASDEAYAAANLMALRNTSLFNLMDRPAVSLPIGTPDGGPVGLMVIGETGGDADLLDVAEAMEAVLADL